MNTSSPAAHIRSLRSQIASISEKLCSLDASTKELDDSIREKIAFLRALNAIQSPSGRLPPEVLSYIFKLTAPQPVSFSRSDEFPRAVRTHFPLNLCAVSSHWREVVHSTPSLWTSASFFVKGTTGKKSNPFLLIPYLENSRNLPLHLAFSYSGMEYTSSGLVDQFVDPILIANLPRVKTLILCSPPSDSQWYSHFDKLTAAVDLVLEWTFRCRSSVEVLRLNKCQSLRRFSICDNVMSERLLYKLPFSITVLDLGSLPIDTIVKLLFRCPNIVEFYLDNPIAPFRSLNDSLRASWFGTPVTFEHLEAIRWYRSVYDWGSAFLECVRTPALRILRMSDLFLDFGGTAAEATFFARASRTLSTLELNWVRGIEEHTNHSHFFTSDSPVENLILSECAGITLAQVCSKLMPTGTITAATKLMPKLKTLTVEKCIMLYGGVRDYYVHPEPELEPEHFEPLLPMLERRLVRGGSFRLVFTDVMVDWTPRVQAGLRELVRKGVGLEIVEDGDIVDWL